MAQSADTSRTKLLEKVANLTHHEFDLDSEDLSLKCFYCGHVLNTGVDSDLTVNINLQEGEPYNPKDNSIRDILVCGRFFGGCGYSYQMVYPQQMDVSAGRCNRLGLWKKWFLEEQKWCEKRELVPKWLKGYYGVENRGEETVTKK